MYAATLKPYSDWISLPAGQDEGKTSDQGANNTTE